MSQRARDVEPKVSSPHLAAFLTSVTAVTKRDTKPWHNLCTIIVTGVLHQTRRGWKAAVRATFERAAFLLDQTERPSFGG